MSVRAAPTERSAGRGAPPPALSGTLALPRLGPGVWLGLGIAAALSAIAFGAGGGLQLGSTTTVEMALSVGGGATVAATLIAAPRRGSLDGATATALLLGLALLTAASVVWSLQPDQSWLEASRTLSYAATFALAVALVRLVPERWPSVLAGVALAGVVVCGWAVLTKVFPGSLNPDEIFARLREPYGYWNSVGLTAALAVPPLVWLGARRSGHAALNALAYPALGLLLVTILLSYSRGGLLALALGMAFWFAAVPLRLRGVAVLGISAMGALAVGLWDFSQPALTKDHIVIAARTHAGHRLGVLIAVMLVALLAAGLAIGFFTARRPPSPRTRRRAGVAVLVALALAPVVGAIGLAASSRGLTGSISHAVDTLTNPHARTPANDPSRLTAIGSVRARYWNEALKIFKANPIIGVGAGAYGMARLRYRQDTLNVQHAHGYVVQTLADLGIVGLLVSLAVAIAVLLAAARATEPFGWRPRLPRRLARGAGATRDGPASHTPLPYTPERIGLLTLFACVIVFGLHSFYDWTWFVPGNACVALLCAGWLAGRGPLGSRRPTTPLRRLRSRADWRALEPWRAAAAAAVVAIALLVAWSQWQPLRSQNAADASLAALGVHDIAAARADVRTAIARNPLSVDPLFDEAAIETSAGNIAGAQRALQQAVRLQPSNAETWLRLADFDLTQRHNRAAALRDVRPAVFLDPQSIQNVTELLTVLRSVKTVGHAAARAAVPAITTPGPTAPPVTTPGAAAPATTTPGAGAAASGATSTGR